MAEDLRPLSRAAARAPRRQDAAGRHTLRACAVAYARRAARSRRARLPPAAAHRRVFRLRGAAWLSTSREGVRANRASESERACCEPVQSPKFCSEERVKA